MGSNCVKLLGRLKKLKRCRIYVLVCGIRSPVICYCSQFDIKTRIGKNVLDQKKNKGRCKEFVLLALPESIK